MNRTDRLLAIIWLLRSRHKMKAEELADIFGVNVRSIYRDVQALVEANVPVISLPGPDGGYSLMKEYSVTPITFSDAEIAALYLGATFLNATQLGSYEQAIRSAIDKIARVLPESQVRRLKTLQGAVHPDVGGHVLDESEQACLQILEKAILQSTTIHAVYRAPDGKETERDIDPYGMVLQSGYWYTVGFCRLRQAMRMFRIDRFKAVNVTDHKFKRPDDFSLDPYLFRTWDEEQLNSGPRQAVRLRCTPSWASYFEVHPYYRRCNPRKEGEELLLDIPESARYGLVRTVLGARGRIEVAEPADLRQEVLTYAQELVQGHQTKDLNTVPNH